MKRKTIAGILALTLGGFIGAHKFYLGKPVKGFLYMIFFWTMIPFILSITEAFTFFTMPEDRFDRMFHYKS